MCLGITCRIYMAVSQELISLVDPMGNSNNAMISVILLWFILLDFTLWAQSIKETPRKCISWNIQNWRRAALAWIIGAVNIYAMDPAFCSSRNFKKIKLIWGIWVNCYQCIQLKNNNFLFCAASLDAWIETINVLPPSIPAQKSRQLMPKEDNQMKRTLFYSDRAERKRLLAKSFFKCSPKF